MKAVIISGGNPPNKDLLYRELDNHCYVICADSGANCLANYNIIPHYLIGDFDSINAETLDYFKTSKCIIEKHPVNKDFTDTELALLKAKDLKANSVTFLGCTGTRLDHTLGNINLLYKCLEYGIQGSICDNNNQVFLTKKPMQLTGEKGDVFSIIPYSTNIQGLTIEGAKYPLKNYDLHIGDSITLSNEFLDKKVNIFFEKGTLLIIKSID